MVGLRRIKIATDENNQVHVYCVGEGETVELDGVIGMIIRYGGGPGATAELHIADPEIDMQAKVDMATTVY